MKAIPAAWLGKWVDDIGRTLTIDPGGDHHHYKVSIRDQSGKPFDIDNIGFLESGKKTLELKSALTIDHKGKQHLQVEAGMVGIGPTYRLYFATETQNKQLRLALNTDPVEKIIIKPDIGMGLYDDFEDDLGVPWALPLNDYKKV